MNTDFRYFPLIVQDIVTEVAKKWDTINNLKPFYHFGTYLELTKRVAIKDSIDAEKYPLIWLVWEANESQQDWLNDVTYTVQPRLFICNFTSSDYSSAERYAANFQDVLFPIWELFKKELMFNLFASTSKQFQFRLAEHLLWGESLGFQKTQNVLFDTLDAIEIKFTSLEINKNC